MIREWQKTDPFAYSRRAVTCFYPQRSKVAKCVEMPGECIPLLLLHKSKCTCRKELTFLPIVWAPHSTSPGSDVATLPSTAGPHISSGWGLARCSWSTEAQLNEVAGQWAMSLVSHFLAFPGVGPIY